MSEYLELKEKGLRKVLTLNSVKCLECGEVLVSKSQHNFPAALQEYNIANKTL